MSERVLVIGGTRGTGFEIVRLLLRDGYRVRALARNPAKAQKKFSLFSAAVEIMVGDITKPGSLPSAMRDVEHIIFTVGVASRPTGEKLIIETEYEGVKNVLAAAREAQFKGRFLYMSSIGVTRPSFTTRPFLTLPFASVRDITRPAPVSRFGVSSIPASEGAAGGPRQGAARACSSARR